jgi:single-strand DNA-binding protein
MTMTFKIAGNLAADPEFTTFKGGEGVRARLRVATDRPVAEGKFETDYLDLVVFGATAEAMREAHTGDRIEASGSVRPTSYDKDGERRFSINFVANRATWQSKNSAGIDRSMRRTKVASDERTDKAAAASR